MKRKVVWVLLVCLMVLSLVLASCAPKVTEEGAAPKKAAEPEYVLKWACWTPPLSVFPRTFMWPWAKAIEEETGGRVRVDFYIAETLVKAPDNYDAVRTGTIDFTCTSPSRNPGRFPLHEMCSLPFLWQSSLTANLAVLEAEELGYFGDEYKDVKLIGFHANGPANISHRTKYIKTIEDWKGQRYNGAGWVQTEMAKLLGAVPVSLTPTEVYESLQKGLIDMYLNEWEGQYVFKGYEVTKYRTDRAAIQIGAAGFTYLMNLDTYNKMPADIKTAFDKYSNPRTVAELNGANMDRECKVRYDDIVAFDQKMGNPAVYNLPAAERQRYVELMQPLYEKYITDLEAKGVTKARETFNKLVELSAKYAKMYPSGSDAEYAMWKKYGYECLYPGYPEGFIMPPQAGK